MNCPNCGELTEFSEITVGKTTCIICDECGYIIPTLK